MASIWDSIRKAATTAKKKLYDKEGIFQQGRFVPQQVVKQAAPVVKNAYTAYRKVTPYIPFSPNIAPVKPNPVNRVANTVFREITSGAKTFGEGLGGAITAPFRASQLRAQTDVMTQQSQRNLNLARQLLSQGRKTEAQQLLRQNQKLASGVISQANKNIKFANTGMKKTAFGGLRTLGTVAGANILTNPAALAMGGGLGAGLTALTGGDPLKGAGKGIGMLPRTYAITRLTNPVINAALGKTGTVLAKPLAKAAAKFVVGGTANVLEDEIINKLYNEKSNKTLSFLMGGIMAQFGSKGQAEDYERLSRKSRAALNRAANKLKLDTRPAGDVFVFAPGDPKAKIPMYLYEQMRYKPQSYESSIKLPDDIKAKNYTDVKLPKGTKPQLEVQTKGSKLTKAAQQQSEELLPFEQTLKGGKTKLPVGKEGQLPQSLGGSSKTIIPKSKKYVYNVNVEKLDLDKPEQQVLKKTINVIKPELESAKGKKLSNKEVVEAAKKSELLQKVTNREQTLISEAQLLKTRQRMVQLDKEVAELTKKGNTPELRARISELVDQIKTVSAEAADRGRQLQALSIEASEETLRQKVLKEVLKVENDSSKVVKAAGNVNWDNANEVYKFYRSFIKPSFGEIIDEYRYNNMLSNPRTHLRNAYSNLLQTIVTRPATIAAQGDIKGTFQYYKGAIKSLPEAVDNLVKSFKGEAEIKKPDLTYAPTTKLSGVLTWPTRAMEAADQFYSTLIRGGELARGASEIEAGKTAEYSLFRQGLKPEGQGKLLNAIDDFTAWTYKAPKAVRWFVPFIRTPMNVLKQWIEYSPAGIATLPGAANQKEQIAKTIVGTIPFVMGAYLALEDRTTWSAPTDPQEKEAFYASGRKPFSVKVGNDWVSMQYFGPFGLAVALPAAYKNYAKDDRKALTDSSVDKVTKAMLGSLEYLSGQTFLDGMNNFVKMFSGDIDYTMPKNLAYSMGQTIPLEGLVRYVSTIVDPTYRRAKGFTEEMIKNIPFASKTLEPYTTPEGQPSTREKRNLITPFDITKSVPKYEQKLEERSNYLQQRNYVGDKYGSTTFSQSQINVISTYERLKDMPAESSKEEIVGMYKRGKLTKTEVKNLIKLRNAEKMGLLPEEQALIIRGSTTKAKYVWSKISTMSNEEQKKVIIDYYKKGLVDESVLKELFKLKVGK